MDKLMEKVIEADYSSEELRAKRSSSITVRNCPWCEHLWKLNINAEKGVYRCARCGEAGNAIKLHAKLRDVSYEEAKEELLGIEYKPTKKIELVSHKELSIASLQRRNSIYSTMMKHGYCSKNQYDDLLKRGMGDDQTKWYATVVDGMNNTFQTWCKECDGRGLLENGEIRGVPGLYGRVMTNEYGKEKTDELYLNFPKNIGYLIPVITHLNGKPMISCMQIRHLKGDLRYSYFTSGDDKLKNGCSTSECNKIHYTRNFWKEGKMTVPKTVNLTEGALKADVASVLSGRQFIAVLGVNNTRDLSNELKFLKANGCENINVCFDMDYQKNPNVKKALGEVYKIIEKAGLKLRKISWDEKYKGIDDYLLAQKKMLEGGKEE